MQSRTIVELASAVFIGVLCASGAAAQNLSTEIAFDIPPQPLAPAVIAFSEQTGFQIVTAGEDLSQLNTRGVQGRHNISKALAKLLEGTQLTYALIGEATVSVYRPSSSAAQPVKRTSLLAQETPSAESQAEETTKSVENKATPALEEIVVTAEKRAESIQDLPIAISAFSGETLIDRGIEGMESLQQLAPSVQFGEDGFGLAKVSIRGISTEVIDIWGEPAMAISQDGVVYANQFLLGADFFDVERVEVLRGPQGTISGRNGTAGAINIHSKRPTETFEGGFKATLGNYSRIATEGYLSGPISEGRLLGRLAVRSDRADGWVTNTLLGEELGVRDRLQARASLLAKLTDTFEAHLILDGTRDRSNPVIGDIGRVRADTPSVPEFFGVPAFDHARRTVQQDQPFDFDYEKYQGTLKLVWELHPSATLASTTGYVDLDFPTLPDADGTAVPVIFWDPVASRRDVIGIRQVSQELILTADLTDRLDVIFGALYMQSDAQMDITIGLPLLGLPVGFLTSLSDADLKSSWGGYTSWRYRLTDNLRLSAGVRYTHDSKTYNQTDIVFGAPTSFDVGGSWNAWTPRFALDYTPSDDLTLYASVSRGFKSGGFQPFGQSKFEPEYISNYEVGLKGNWLEDSLRTAVTAFYMDYTDLQQNLFTDDPERPAQTFQVINAESSSIRGVELELEALVTDRFQLSFAGAWLDATYGEMRSHDQLFPELGTPGAVGVNVRDLSGNQLVRAPEWQFNFSGEYTVPLRGNLQGMLRASYAWQDKVFFNIFNHAAVSQKAYGLINLSAAIETDDGKWQLSANIRNLGDELYRTTAFANPPGLTPVGFSGASFGLPRTYDVGLAYRF